MEEVWGVSFFQTIFYSAKLIKHVFLPRVRFFLQAGDRERERERRNKQKFITAGCMFSFSFLFSAAAFDGKVRIKCFVGFLSY